MGLYFVSVYSPITVVYVHDPHVHLHWYIVVTGQFYGKISGNVDTCTVSVYQALLSPHEREPGFEARATIRHAY